MDSILKEAQRAHYRLETLQDFMLEHGMINKKEAMMNMLYIRAFVNTPLGAKKVLYEKLLRK